MSNVSAKVVAHSKFPCGTEVLSLEIELHRFILPEFNTHRKISKNFQSSRAVPILKLIEQVATNPAMPLHWGKNQAGMVADEELDSEVGMSIWQRAAKAAAGFAKEMMDAGYHKQIVNRLLEPFMWTKGFITLDRGAVDAFLALRDHFQAQPEIQALAKAIKEAVDESEYEVLDYGEYHLPYVSKFKYGGVLKYGILSDFNTPVKFLTLEEAVKVSTSCTAQVSYRMLDNSLEKALNVFNMLNLPSKGVYNENPPHFSPTEHVLKAVAVIGGKYKPEISGNILADSVWQYRKALEVGKELKFLDELEIVV